MNLLEWEAPVMEASPASIKYKSLPHLAGLIHFKASSCLIYELL